MGMGIQEFERQRLDQSQRFYVDNCRCDGSDSGGYHVIDRATGNVVGHDGGEPEDQSLVRDWQWVSAALNAVAAESAAKDGEIDEATREVVELRVALMALLESADLDWDGGSYVNADVEKAVLRAHDILGLPAGRPTLERQAAESDAKDQRIAELERALKPFAAAWRDFMDRSPKTAVFNLGGRGEDEALITPADIKAARAALAAAPLEPKEKG